MYKLLIGWMLICVPLEAGALGVTATRPARITAPGNPKAWMQDPAEFLSTRIDTRWIIGRSTRPCVTDGEANDVACRNAAEQIAPLLVGRLRFAGRADHEWLLNRLHADLMAGRCVRDRP